ncbi:MAG TPA: hypothetical protein VGS09_02175 [Actinomycetota bacterium]|nr:hypothetical protein [Actinomycetota bacterium]
MADREGVIVGMAEEGQSGAWYAVLVDGKTYSIEEEALEATGRIVARGELYDGSSVRVTLEGEVGEGNSGPAKGRPT